MLTAEEQAYILEHAYVPEHCISLITRVSGGEPFLVDDFFVCLKGSGIILSGYPLDEASRRRLGPSCVGWLEKPFVMERLMDAVTAAFRSSRRDR